MIYLPKCKIFGLASLIAILSLATFPQYGFSQIPTLDKLNLEAGQSPQCLDFNQDKICEYLVLLNGTMVKNPDATGSQSLSSFVAKDPDATGSQSTVNWTDPKTGITYYDIPTQGYYCLDFDNDYICDVDFNNGKMVIYGESQSDQPQIEDEAGGNEEDEAGGGNGENNNVNPYCDQVGYSQECHDRKDFDQETGLYPCNDGSYKEDWKECDDVSGGGNNDDEDEDEEANNDYEVAEGYEDDGYIDENEDGNYDEGEE
jgi:hypothetical protein